MSRIPGVRFVHFWRQLVLLIGIASLGFPAGLRAQAQAIHVSPSAFDFGAISINATSRMQSIEVRNSGRGYLKLSKFEISAPFAIYARPSLPLTLLPGETTHVIVYFAPRSSGLANGRLIVSSNATSGGNSISFTGRGGNGNGGDSPGGGDNPGGPVATVSTTRVDFGSQALNTRSSARSVILTNSGRAALNISSIDVSGEFSQVNNCPADLPPVASCQVNVTFAPSSTGAHSGNISFSHNGPNSPQTVALAGAGAGSGDGDGSNSVSLNPSALNFGDVNVGGASRYQTVAVSNAGQGYLKVTGLSVTTQFTITSGPRLPLTLLPGETTHVNVAFTPTRTGALSGTLAVSSNASSDPSTVALSGGSGDSQEAPQINITPGNLNFGGRNIGDTSGVQTVSLRNTGSAELTISEIASSATQYAIVSAPTVPFTLGAGQAANVGVTFTPTSNGALAGSLTITSNTATSPSAISLTGSGITSNSRLRMEPNSLNFGNLRVGGTSSAQTIRLTNASSEDVTVTSIAATPAQFVSAYGNIPFTLGPGESRSVDVTFAPVAAGSLTGTLAIASDAPSSPDSATLSGTATGAGTGEGEGGELDTYGGTKALACPDGPKARFYTQKIGNRWWLCTPAGNAFWLRSIYHVDGNDSGADYQGVRLSSVIQQKYGNNSTTWGPVTIKRMQSWGFNATAEYSSAYVQPVTTHSGWSTPDHTNPEKMPFIGFMWPSHYARNANRYAAPIKELIRATNSNYRGSRRDCLDIFDPNLDQWLRRSLQDSSSPEYRWIHSAHTDYLIGINVDDPDELFGFGAGPDFKGFSHGRPDDFSHVHLGLIALITPSRQSSGRDANGNGISYSDTTVYTKQALSDWLASRYNNNINLLNRAWGSNYTTFGSDGGWPNGRGVLDEDGRHDWVRTLSRKNGNGNYDRSDDDGEGSTRANVQRDLDAFLVVLSDKYFSTIKRALQAEAPGVLYLGPTNLGSWGAPPRKEILQGGAPYLDAIMLATIPTQCLSCSDDQQRMDFVTQYGGDKPWINWEAISGAPDSYMSVFPVTQVSTPYATTQGLRGQQFQKMVNDMVSARDSAGTYHIVGYKWWQYYDSRGEQANWGFVTPRDNPYDGVSAVISSGTDQFGYRTGGERVNYGDFISGVTASNKEIYQRILGLP